VHETTYRVVRDLPILDAETHVVVPRRRLVCPRCGPKLEKLLGKKIPVKRGDWRPGDQKVFVADIRKAGSELGWAPRIGVEEGVKRLFEWVVENKELF
jgi:GDP-D-mannose dehydratase